MLFLSSTINSPCEFFRVKPHFVYFSPPEARGAGTGAEAKVRREEEEAPRTREVKNTLFCPSHEKSRTVVFHSPRKISGNLKSPNEISRVTSHVVYFPPPDPQPRYLNHRTSHANGAIDALPPLEPERGPSSRASPQMSPLVRRREIPYIGRIVLPLF